MSLNWTSVIIGVVAGAVLWYLVGDKISFDNPSSALSLV